MTEQADRWHGEDIPSELLGAPRRIGLINEKPLHAALKRWYARPGDRREVAINGFTVDIVRGNQLVEIRTTNFAAVKRKLTTLVETHPVRLVYPIAQEKWILKLAEDGEDVLGHRKSPRRGCPEDVFHELVSIPALLAHPNFSIELLLVWVEELHRLDGKIGRHGERRVIRERRLVDVVERLPLETPADIASLVPSAVPEPFTTADLADASGRPRGLAQKMAYCLRAMGRITPVGKRGNMTLYARV